MSESGKQLTIWGNIESMNPQEMRIAAQGRRRGILADCLQLSRDVDYYNKKHNIGEHIQLLIDFTEDVSEIRHPTFYSDSPTGDDSES